MFSLSNTFGETTVSDASCSPESPVIILIGILLLLCHLGPLKAVLPIVAGPLTVGLLTMFFVRVFSMKEENLVSFFELSMKRVLPSFRGDN